MFPILFSFNSFEFRTLHIFLFLGFFLSSFIFWRKGREEHYLEGEFFDGFVLSVFFGAIAARISFIALNISTIGWNVLNWFDIFNYPGTNLIFGLIVAGLYVYKYAIKNKWDAYEVLDFWVTSVAFGLSVYHFGLFFDGSGFGNPTSLPWGIVFPQLLEPHHPVMIYQAIFYAILYIYLSKVEYSYRTFSWYRHGKKTAQTGFLTSNFLIAVALFTLLISIIKPPLIELFSVNFDVVISVVLLFVGIAILYVRSGRPIPLFFSRRIKVHRTRIEDLREEE